MTSRLKKIGKIFGHGGIRSRYRATTKPLPLGTLVYATDSTTEERTDAINSNLAKLLGQFAFYINPANTQTLGSDNLQNNVYTKIYRTWLFPYLVPDSTDLTKAEVFGTYPNQYCKLRTSLQTPADLFAAMAASVSSLGDFGYLVYLGLYLFTAWHFLNSTDEYGVLAYDPDQNALGPFNQRVLGKRVRRYLATQCLNWQWNGWPDSPVSLKPETVLHGTEYALWFLRQVRVEHSPLKIMANSINLGDPDVFAIPPALKSKFLATGAQDASMALIDHFRKEMAAIIKSEYLELLRKAALDQNWNVKDITCYAVGEGGDTKGFFGIENIGNCFFNYEVDPIESAKRNRYEPKFERSITLSNDRAGKVPKVFIAQWGANANLSRVSVTVGKRLSGSQLEVASSKMFLSQSTPDSQFTYNGNSGVLKFQATPSDKLSLTFFTPRGPTGTGDETVFFTMSYYDSEPSIELIQLPDPRLRIDYLFADNDFVIPTGQAMAFWTPGWPAVTPAEGALEQSTLNQLILKMRDDPTFIIESSIAGMGIGRRIDLFESNIFQSDLIPADSQLDDQVPNTVATGNQYLRYAYGEVGWQTGTNGEVSVLKLCTEGYASPLRCTWENWAPFLTYVAALGSTKATALWADIGQFMRTSSHLPMPYKQLPSYNTALSAFRAFGMMEAMIKRLKDAADDLTPSQLSSDQSDAIKARLDNFLASQASTVLLQVGLDRMTPVTITYALFLKYAY